MADNITRLRAAAQQVEVANDKTVYDINRLAEQLRQVGEQCDADTMGVVDRNAQIRDEIAKLITDCETSAQLYREETQLIYDKLGEALRLVEAARQNLYQINRIAQAERDQQTG